MAGVADGAIYQLTYSTVEPLHNGHLGAEESGRGGLNKSQCMDCPPKSVAIVERRPLVEVLLY